MASAPGNACGDRDRTNGQWDRCFAAVRSGKLEVVLRITRAQGRLQVSMSHASHAIKRRYPRVALPKGMLVAWQHAGGRSVSRVATVGLGGLFVSTPAPPGIGTRLKIVFDVPGGEVRARAFVKNVKPGKGMAVAFIEMGYAEPCAAGSVAKALVGLSGVTHASLLPLGGRLARSLSHWHLFRVR